MVKVTMIELIARTHESYRLEVQDYESKRNGNAEVDKVIDKLIEQPSEKMKTLELMFEIEAGRPMFMD